MPTSNFEWIRRVKAVDREYKAVHFSMNHLQIALKQDPGSLSGDLEMRDLSVAEEHLEGTYIIRLFAEFETCLRKFWENALQRSTRPRMRDLIDGISSSCRIPFDQVGVVHSLREFRNSLVHENEEAFDPLTIGEARSRLCRYLSFLPGEW